MVKVLSQLTAVLTILSSTVVLAGTYASYLYIASVISDDSRVIEYTYSLYYN